MEIHTNPSLFLSFPSQAESSGIFELRLKSFRNDRGRDNVGVCCSGRSEPKSGKCIGTCKTRFRVCLKNYQATIDPNSRCTFGDVVTPVLGDNSVNLTNQQPEGFVNPIRFPFEFTWPVSLAKQDFLLWSCSLESNYYHSATVRGINIGGMHVSVSVNSGTGYGYLHSNPPWYYSL